MEPMEDVEWFAALDKLEELGFSVPPFPLPDLGYNVNFNPPDVIN